MEFGLGTAKGEIEEGRVISNPWMLGKMDEGRARYTGEAVVEKIDSTGGITFAWGPVVYEKAEDIRVLIDGAYVPVPADKLVKDAKGVVIGIAAGYMAEGTRVAYRYDNVVVPQAKLPTLVGRMKNIAITAKARRIAVYYSQIAAFQAKNDYGIDFESVIAQQAQAELQYEIDAEAVFMLRDAADKAVAEGRIDRLEWIDEELDTISYSMKAEGFAKKIEQAKMAVYKRTNRFQPNWMLVSPGMMPILTFVPGFKAASAVVANGPYVAGEIAGMKVVVSPALVPAEGEVCYLGILGNDGKTAVGYYAPYLPLIPTQLLGFADGGMEQGFSTMYAMGMLNDELMCRIDVKKGILNAAKVEIVE